MTPLTYRDIYQLLQYIHYNRNFENPRQFHIQIYSTDTILLSHMSNVNVANIKDNTILYTVEHVEDIQQYMEIFNTRDNHIKTIEWGNHNQEEILIDVLKSKVYLKTDSLSFTEMCRHKLNGTAVKKFMIDLKIRPAAAP